jgi:hypothetical protein
MVAIWSCSLLLRSAMAVVGAFGPVTLPYRATIALQVKLANRRLRPHALVVQAFAL